MNYDELKGQCLDCDSEMEVETDIQLCQKCMGNYNLDKLWLDHDNNIIDALDFNESIKIRNKYRIRIKK